MSILLLGNSKTRFHTVLLKPLSNNEFSLKTLADADGPPAWSATRVIVKGKQCSLGITLGEVALDKKKTVPMATPITRYKSKKAKENRAKRLLFDSLSLHHRNPQHQSGKKMNPSKNVIRGVMILYDASVGGFTSDFPCDLKLFSLAAPTPLPTLLFCFSRSCRGRFS